MNISKISKEEYRRNKDLDAARKAGTAQPAVDEDGKAINPHIPEFMAKAPWYMSTGETPSLKHQKVPSNFTPAPADPVEKLKGRFNRGIKSAPAATKFRPGACTNCGAMSHKQKDCLERPRKKGAKFTGQDIAADEVIHDQNAHLNGREGHGDYDAKRDRWDGYDVTQYSTVVLEHEVLEQARRKMREEAIDSGRNVDNKQVKKAAKVGKSSKKKKDDDFGSSDDSDTDDDDANDEDKYAEGADVAGQKVDTKTRITVRNLRIREDTAKYLRNLDPESAHYDPKTRSMREAPNPEIRPEDAVFAGDNFARDSGESTEHQRLQLFAWQSEQRGHDVHVNSNPTASHLLHKEFQEKKKDLKETSSTSILAKYGGEQYLQSVPKELLTGQTENYVEYSRTGQVIKGQERLKAKSKYEEDVYPGNHTSVWGSYFELETAMWGYACCNSTVKRSYCAGEAGKATAVEMVLREEDPAQKRKSEETVSQENHEPNKKRIRYEGRTKDLGEGDVDSRLDKEKLKEALSGKRRDGDTNVTEEEMEAYRMQRKQFDDPLANIKGDELLPL